MVRGPTHHPSGSIAGHHVELQHLCLAETLRLVAVLEDWQVLNVYGLKHRETPRENQKILGKPSENGENLRKMIEKPSENRENLRKMIEKPWGNGENPRKMKGKPIGTWDNHRKIIRKP